MTQADQTFDLLIVGAGMVGAALALALKSLPARIALVDAKPLLQEAPQGHGFELRVSTINRASENFLRQLGVWSLMDSKRLGAFQSMQVWDADGTGQVDFSADLVGESNLGHVVENRRIQAALHQVLAEQDNLTLVQGQVSEVWQGQTDGASRAGVRLADGRQLSSGLLVAADGAQSRVRNQLGIASREWDYGHQAIVTTVACEYPHQYCARQAFLTTGPLAFLPLSRALPNAKVGESTPVGEQPLDERHCSIVWSCDQALAERLLALDDQAFAVALERAFAGRLGAIQWVDQRLAFALRQRHAKQYCTDAVALIGDAAHSIHPLAGQGVNLGFADAKALAEELLRASQRGLILNHRAVLGRFQRRRQGHNLSMMGAMEGFKRLFEQSSLPVRWLRNLGMRGFQSNDELKALAMRRALGL